MNNDDSDDNRSVVFNTLHLICAEKGYATVGDIAYLPISRRTRYRITASLVAGGHFRRVGDRLYAVHRRGAHLVAPPAADEYEAIRPTEEELAAIRARLSGEEPTEGRVIFNEYAKAHPGSLTSRSTILATSEEMLAFIQRRKPVQVLPENYDDFHS